MGRSLTNHTKWITALSWQPLHLSHDGKSNRVASSSEDGTMRIWNTDTGVCCRALSGHTQSVKTLKWSGQAGQGGQGFLYSASKDRTVKVWSAADVSTKQFCATNILHNYYIANYYLTLI